MRFVAALWAVVTSRRMRPRLPSRLLYRALREEPALGFYFQGGAAHTRKMNLHTPSRYWCGPLTARQSGDLRTTHS